MSWLELTVHEADGTARVERTERDDARGRRAIDQAAFERLERPWCARVEVRRVSRIANPRGAGRFR